MIRASVDVAGPIYFRIGRGRDPQVYTAEDLACFTLGKAVTHGTGRDLTIVATGSMVHPSLEAADALRGEGLSVGVIDMHTIKPSDAGAIAALSGNTDAVLPGDHPADCPAACTRRGPPCPETASRSAAGTGPRRHGLCRVGTDQGPASPVRRAAWWLGSRFGRCPTRRITGIVHRARSTCPNPERAGSKQIPSAVGSAWTVQALKIR
jgi:hypothetical protein